MAGWYRAMVREYDGVTDTVKLEFDVEDVLYDYVVCEEGKKLKLAKHYENFFQIGALVKVTWSKEDVVEADLLPRML